MPPKTACGPQSTAALETGTCPLPPASSISIGECRLPYAVTKQIGHERTDGKAQACATKAPGVRTLDLAKAIEDEVVVFGRDANTLVFDGADYSLLCTGLSESSTDHHCAFTVRELNRIQDEVDEGLIDLDPVELETDVTLQWHDDQIHVRPNSNRAHRDAQLFKHLIAQNGVGMQNDAPGLEF